MWFIPHQCDFTSSLRDDFERADNTAALTPPSAHLLPGECSGNRGLGVGDATWKPAGEEEEQRPVWVEDEPGIRGAGLSERILTQGKREVPGLSPWHLGLPYSPAPLRQSREVSTESLRQVVKTSQRLKDCQLCSVCLKSPWPSPAAIFPFFGEKSCQVTLEVICSH